MPLFDLPLDQLRDYAPTVVEPADFDAFWQATLEQPADLPVLVEVRPEPTDLHLVDTWDVTFAGFAGDPVRAWYTRPAGNDDDLPAVVEYVGYGRGRGLPHERLTWPVAGYAHLLMDARGQSGQYGAGDTADPHGAAPGGPAPVTRGILSPEGYHYRRLITDAVRAVQAVRVLPGVDPSRVVVAGNSQGGGLALAVAGLVPDLTAVLTTAPFLCHPQRAIEITEVGVYGEIVNYLAVNRTAEAAVRRTLSYVDGVNFARRATAPVHFGIGLRDMVCPPSTGFAAHNHYGTACGGPVPVRELHVYPFNGHEHGEAVHVRRQLRWLATLLDTSPPKLPVPSIAVR
ncbi:acetylxylan esterase [Micromonospora endophytica]|uniref:Acetylxylan esterase n=1 Tax=Micromonospora endophytica TaxID=515350 RepID=A0A2W2CMV4_9ACTN|nr:acetylxylan esterase [Micromonospora endophytica]PZF99882.1 acetylxylan esterase [Micromonospora endophytica]RIW42004.1 acetylxylan esterase [Micromonospora endophytica]BCJ56823.1 acetylxylan esterase [Micromonospora endophytica]